MKATHGHGHGQSLFDFHTFDATIFTSHHMPSHLRRFMFLFTIYKVYTTHLLYTTVQVHGTSTDGRQDEEISCSLFICMILLIIANTHSFPSHPMLAVSTCVVNLAKKDFKFLHVMNAHEK